MVQSDSIRLYAVLILRGKCLNGRRDVVRDLCQSRQASEGIAHAREAQAEFPSRFIEGAENYWLLSHREISLGVMASGLPSRFP
jgi:hypothetical protein